MLLSLILLAACADPPPPPVAAAPSPPPPVAPSLARVEAGVVLLDSSAGPIRITPVYHSTTRIELGGKVLWLDPWSKANLADQPKADILLITDIHPDHLDQAAIDLVRKEGTVVVAPKAVAEALEGLKIDHVLDNGATVNLDGLEVRAEPMYNLVRGPEEGKLFHDKGRGDGFLLSWGGRTVYFAGDTECTPEMRALHGVDLAFIPMNLPYTMPPEEAAACVAEMKPGAVVPYHYAGSDLSVFKAGVGGVPVLDVDYYPGGLPW